MTIYISGRITGLPNAKELFNEAELRLKAQGYKVVNPCNNGVNSDSWTAHMKADIKLLMDCDAIYLLSNWKQSEGARIERFIAWSLGYEMIKE